MKMTVEQKFLEKTVIEENAPIFARFNRVTGKLFSEKWAEEEANINLKSDIKILENTINDYKKEISKLTERVKKQEFLEKSNEIQKESVKIVSNKVKKSKDNVEIKKTITELIQEIDACIALLNEE